MLRRLYAHNFRCLVNFELALDPAMLLVGRNGTGKTSVFEALRRIQDLAMGKTSCGDEESFHKDTRTRWLASSEQHFELDVALPPDLNFRYTLKLDDAHDGQPRVRHERLDLAQKRLFEFDLGEVRLFSDQQEASPKVMFTADWHRSGLALVAPHKANKKLTKFKQWLEHLRIVRIDPWAISEQSQRESRDPAYNFENLADWFRHLQQESTELVAAAVADLREAIPGFNVLNSKQAGRQYREIIATIDGPDNKTVEVSLSELSDGQRCLVCLYLLLRAELDRGGTVLIDEPENFIALREIQPWLKAAIEAVEDKGSQLVLASHHPEILNQMVAESARLLVRADGGHTMVRPFPDLAMAPAEVVARGWEDAAR